MAGVSIVRQWERLIVLHFGKLERVAYPGIRWLWPIINNGIRSIFMEFSPCYRADGHGLQRSVFKTCYIGSTV